MAVASQHGEAQRCAKGMMEASDAATKALARQHSPQHREARRCVKGMAEARAAVTKAVPTDKAAQGGTTMCIGHGGGKRCSHYGCAKSAQGGTTMCKGHGGGKRCCHYGGDRSAEGATMMCVGHGGGKRCNHEGCDKSARRGGTMIVTPVEQLSSTSLPTWRHWPPAGCRQRIGWLPGLRPPRCTKRPPGNTPTGGIIQFW